MERLTGNIDTQYFYDYLDKNTQFNSEFVKKIYDKLVAYEKAEEQARLMVLPFARGNILYRLAGDEILEECVTDVVFRTVGDWSLYSNFNKTVFLTREEAEVALNKKTLTAKEVQNE